MRAVLISTKPLRCENILNGKKTVEIRKTRPKLKPPFKVYIYCTKAKNIYENLWTGKNQIIEKHSDTSNGKVVGEFICDRVEKYMSHIAPDERAVSFSIPTTPCMTKNEMWSYSSQGMKTLYGWHISNLKIYDKSKELNKFTGLRKTKFGYAPFKIKRPPQSWFYVEELDNA